MGRKGEDMVYVGITLLVLMCAAILCLIIRAANIAGGDFFLEKWVVKKVVTKKRSLELILELEPKESHPYYEVRKKLKFRRKHPDFSLLCRVSEGDILEFDFVEKKISFFISDYLTIYAPE